MDHINERCKYCNLEENIDDDLLQCTSCNSIVHVRCTQRGSVPGGILGDVFFSITCVDCSPQNVEEFVRIRLAWFQIIYLVLYNYTKRSPGISRQGFYHWKLHVAAFIDRHWDTLFSKDTKRKKMWIGTVSGSLSVYNNFLFTSGTNILTESGWWALKFPNLKPRYVFKYAKEICDLKSGKAQLSFTNFEDFLRSENVPELYLKQIDLEAIAAETRQLNQSNNCLTVEADNSIVAVKIEKTATATNSKKRTNILPTIENIRQDVGFKNRNKLLKLDVSNEPLDLHIKHLNKSQKNCGNVQIKDTNDAKPVILKNPMCHYNTSLNSISRIEGLRLSQKLTGNWLEDTILSPYSGLYLKPYIRRDSETKPTWLSLMTDILLVSNVRYNKQYHIPGRYTIDFAYVQPGHIPAINSMCNHFFWPGIDLTDCLQYPEFSCVALYRRLIVGFAFVVPDVGVNEAYMSFVFVRVGWRNAGIARFMIYHLIQICCGKDMTLHVSINNPALFLYQKFGFKVEKVVLDFYDKYFRRDSFESKHAFFCRLER